MTQQVYEQMPRVGLTNLLVEVASWIDFTYHFDHLKTGEPAKDLELILAAILADGTQLGLLRCPAPRKLVSIPGPARPP